jgi:hypothetical protein
MVSVGTYEQEGEHSCSLFCALRVDCMRPSLLLIKREMGRNLENPKMEISFAVVDSDLHKAYPRNFLCVLPTFQGLLSESSMFSKLFREDKMPLAKKLLSKALTKESDIEIRTEIGKRLKQLNPKKNVKANCRVCRNLF